MHADKRNTRAQAFKRMRALTLGMKVWTWESWKVKDAPDGHPMYGCICKDRWGHDLGKDVFSIAAKISRKWEIKIRVKCKANDGQIYIEETELVADNVKLDDFTELYKREREATINAVNPNHIVDVGWIAKALS